MLNSAQNVVKITTPKSPLEKPPKKVFIVEDDPTFASCLARYCRSEGAEPVIFSDAISAVSALNEPLPSLIFLDILLTGPDGFTFLNETISYEDTAKIPIVIVSSLDFSGQNLDIYGVVATLNKDTLTPKEVKKYVKRYTH